MNSLLHSAVRTALGINDFAHVEIEKLKQAAEEAVLSCEEVQDALDILALDDAYVTEDRQDPAQPNVAAHR